MLVLPPLLGFTTFVASIFLLGEWISSVGPAANYKLDLLACMALLSISILILHTPMSYDSSSCGADDRPQCNVAIGLQDAGIALLFIAL